MLPWAHRPAPERRDWYRSASPEDRREYDAFGPWVYDVTCEEEMPPRFRATWERHRHARFVLKIPIDAERLQCRPGMDLYRTVLAFHDDGLCVMRLDGDVIETREIAWSEIAAVRDYGNLLLAAWILLLTDGDEITVAHSAVGSRRMEVMTAFVRARLAGAPATVSPPLQQTVAVPDLFYRNMLADAGRRSRQPVVPIHFEPPNRPCRNAANRRRLTTGVLFLDTPDELAVVDREDPTRRWLIPTYAVRNTFVPWAALTSWSLDEPEAGSPLRFRDLVLRLDRQTIRCPCLTPPKTVAARLAAHGVPRLA